MEKVSLYTGEEIYRPFWEKDSALLEVELGCSWHGCAFCDFAKDSFKVFALEEIEQKVKMLVPYAKEKKRIFFLGENPFVMSTQKLLVIFGYIRQYMPWIEEISMYARFDDVLRKSSEELRVLRGKGLVHLHIGLESGNDDVLRLMNKGVTSWQGKEACWKLRQAGITFSLTVIPGLGGTKLSEVHVKDTVDFLNEVKPARIWLMGLKVWQDTPLEQLCRNGGFTLLSLEERLREVESLVRGLEVEECSFADTTVLDRYTVMGKLPQDKEKILGWIGQLLGHSE